MKTSGKTYVFILIAIFFTAAVCYGLSADTYNNRGNAYKAKGQHDQANADFIKAAELNPTH